jgi:4-diphosphocytidyl-2C-methyl-D-erythritol kinase
MLSRLAPAKINLTLHVTGQRPDGYHLLDSLVVFAAAGDRVSLAAGEGLTLALSGRYGQALSAEPDNLVLRAARLAGARNAAFRLDKALPLASGMGGGSSDAAAALHLLARAQGSALPDTGALMGLGADLHGGAPSGPHAGTGRTGRTPCRGAGAVDAIGQSGAGAGHTRGVQGTDAQEQSADAPGSAPVA